MAFQENLDGVDKLTNFDRDVLDFTIDQIRDLHQRLTKQLKIDNPDLNGQKTLQLVSGIRKNDSLRSRYETIFNQAIVLLVSYFASTLGDVFRYGVAVRLQKDTESKLLEEEVRLTFAELRERDWTLRESAPDLLIAKKYLSFQDMGATHKAFDQYLRVSIAQDRCVNNIILAQACRHVIVHAGGVVTERMLRQLERVEPRDLKTTLTVGEKIQFTPEEVGATSSNMKEYVDDLVRKVRESELRAS